MKDNIRKYFNFWIWLLLQLVCIWPGVYYAICQSYHSPISIWAHIAFLLMSLFYTAYTFLLAWYKKGKARYLTVIYLVGAIGFFLNYLTLRFPSLYSTDLEDFILLSVILTLSPFTGFMFISDGYFPMVLIGVICIGIVIVNEYRNYVTSKKRKTKGIDIVEPEGV